IRKQYNWGRNGYEGGAITSDNQTVYLGQDGTPGFMIKFEADSPGDFVNGRTYAYKEPTDQVQLSHFSTKTNAQSEISAYDAELNRIYSTHGDGGLLVLDISDLRNVDSIAYVDFSTYGEEVTSVATSGGMIAAAVPNPDGTSNGNIVILNKEFGVMNVLEVGALPDMVTFSPDGNYIVVANEGEPNDDYTIDPDGTISVIDVSNGGMNATVATANFDNFTIADLPASVRIFGNGTTDVSADLEPEFCAVTPDSKTAICACQENNAIAVVDLATATVTSILGLGYKDHSVVPLDPSNSDDSIAYLRTYDNLYGMYQPDAISIIEINGTNYILTANEGDARDYDGYSEEARVADLTLDPTAFPNAAELQEDANLGRLKCTTSQGDTDGDGDFDEIYCYGARSFTIWDFDGNIIFDSGTDFAEVISTQAPQNYADSRDDDKGSEPESIITAVMEGRTFAFIGLERTAGVMVYDISDPANATFVDYYNRDGVDLSPEGLEIIPAESSPSGNPMLISTNEAFDEYGGSVSLYNINGFEKDYWIEINNTDFDKMLNIQQEAVEAGATMFNRLEWVWYDENTNAVYFTETGRDNPGSRWVDELQEGAQYAAHHISRAQEQGVANPGEGDYWDYYGRIIKLDLATDQVSVFLEGGPFFAQDSVSSDGYPDIHLTNPDGLSGFTVNDKNFMIIQEDLNGTSHGRVPRDITSNRTCEMFLLDMSIENPTTEDLIRISVVPQGAEITGAIATPDGKTILVNSQHPSSDNPFPYNHSLTYAITGWDAITTSLTPEFDDADDFSIFPNPAFRTLHFNEAMDVAIYNNEGKRLSVHRNTNNIDIMNLSPGIYYVRNDKGKTKKLVIQR
ncbi:MAG: choice-of-anchor I family protein, partial [Bacteroidota bacterium]